jgi:hypothetical protein
VPSGLTILEDGDVVALERAPVTQREGLGVGGPVCRDKIIDSSDEALGIGEHPLRPLHSLRAIAAYERVWIEGQTQDVAPLPVDERDPSALVLLEEASAQILEEDPQACIAAC